MKNLFQFTLLLVCASFYAQDFAGKATYQTKMVSSEKDDFKLPESRQMSPEKEKEIEEAISKAFEKKYTLTFNKNEALFVEDQELQKPNPKGGAVVMINMSGDGNKYLNVKEKYYIEEEDLMGEEFLIKDSLLKIDWKITDETKKIGDYMCFKAQYTINVTEEEKESYAKFLESQKNNKNAKKMMFLRQEPKPKTYIAWYTPEIPVSIGPKNLWGLPGLILEYSGDEMIFLCTSISIKANEKAKIVVPNTGKKVDKAQFEKFEKKMMQQMEDNGGFIKTKTSTRN